MHAMFVVRRSPSGNHEIVDVHGRLIAVMANHLDVEAITALFLQSPVADRLARTAEQIIFSHSEDSEKVADWLQELEDYRDLIDEGTEAPTT